MTQAEIVLRELRAAGSRGVHTFELRRMYIGNPSQRIAELEKRGYRFTRTREKLNGKATGSRYVLVEEPARQTRVRPSSEPAPVGTLFDERPRNAIFDEAA